MPQKNVGSLNSSERLEELTQEVEGYRLDAILISETWRASNAEIWATQQGHIYHGSWKIREQPRSWNSGEQEVAKTYQLDRLQLRTRHMNVDHSPTTLKRYTDQSRNSRNPKRTTYKLWETSMRNRVPGVGVERVSVGPHTLKEGIKRGDWMKPWPMIQNFTALNTMY